MRVECNEIALDVRGMAVTLHENIGYVVLADTSRPIEHSDDILGEVMSASLPRAVIVGRVGMIDTRD
jgi:hypothetical protein